MAIRMTELVIWDFIDLEPRLNMKVSSGVSLCIGKKHRRILNEIS